ncbi:MAG: protein-L-isoaspartate O-methyltransferase [Erythrobacter sp.]|nr:protein-L-isoaspartate O-methyltransferase [Erythrobacter sp.]
MTMTDDNSAKARKAMIDSQLRTSGVNEEFALGRMMAVAREDFLPEEKASLAYIDRSVPVEGGALASPLFYGKALLEAVPTREDTVLVVEGGTGYLAALLAPLVSGVETVSARDAATGKIGGTYSLIMVDGAIEQLSEGLAGALADDGRIVSGLLLRQVTRLAAGRKIAGQVSLQPVEDIGIPILHEFDAPKTWTFS